MTVRPYRTKAGETRWQYTVELRPGPDGRRRQEHRRGYPDRAAAETAELEARLRVRKGGTRPDPSRMTVADLLDEWLAAVEGTVKPTTYLGYRYQSGIVADRIGDVPVRNLTGAHVQRMVNDCRRAYSPLMVDNIHHRLSAALSLAVDWDLVPRNVARRVVKPPARRLREPEPWTAAQVDRVLAAADARPDRALWRLLLDTGCRIGEALALGWDCVDLDAGTVRIRRTLTKDDANRRVIGESAKTKAGNRLVSLDPETVAALRWQRADQRVRKLAARPVWQERGIVFDRGDGAVVHPDVVARRLGRLCAAAGVPPQTSHGLRHTVITLAVLAGVPLPVIQRRVGHGSIQVTSDVYVAVDEPSDRAASAAVADLVRAARTVRTGANRADETAENRPSVTTTVTTEQRKPSF